jgi:hypothetical protein
MNKMLPHFFIIIKLFSPVIQNKNILRLGFVFLYLKNKKTPAFVITDTSYTVFVVAVPLMRYVYKNTTVHQK